MCTFIMFNSNDIIVTKINVIRIRVNKKDYAYEDSAYWDSALKQGRHRRHCIGYFDGNALVLTGSYCPEDYLKQ